MYCRFPIFCTDRHQWTRRAPTAKCGSCIMLRFLPCGRIWLGEFPAKCGGTAWQLARWRMPGDVCVSSWVCISSPADSGTHAWALIAEVLVTLFVFPPVLRFLIEAWAAQCCLSSLVSACALWFFALHTAGVCSLCCLVSNPSAGVGPMLFAALCVVRYVLRLSWLLAIPMLFPRFPSSRSIIPLQLRRLALANRREERHSNAGRNGYDNNIDAVCVS